MDVFVQRLTAPLACRWSTARRESAKFVRDVDRQGYGLLCRSDDYLAERTQILRAALHREGLTNEWTAEAFAIVRETAARTLGMRHYESQVIGGWAMVKGMLAEMETGEGKTLTATLAAATAALAGIPVHVITVNDYLVSRDAALMAPIYEALGLSVGTVVEAMADTDSRRAAYSCDVTYCTNKQIAFDYLRDRLALGSSRGALHHRLDRMRSEARSGRKLMLRGLCFAIVDEADSVLIDEARTPLILSGPSDRNHDPEVYATALELAAKFDETAGHFELSAERGSVRLSAAGRQLLDDLSEGLPDPWRSRRRREELVTNALVALILRVRDRHYIVRDGAIKIIDDNT
ncbi:MAG TPA: prepilin peptidase, partial [Gammaproteobacteria bacterium]